MKRKFRFILMTIILMLIIPISVKAEDIRSGWINENGNTYYYNQDGTMYKGILDLNGTKYLLGYCSGLLYKNGLATTPDGKTYLTDGNGVIQTGWHQVGGNTYYFDENGMYKGILYLNGTKYLLGYNSGLLYRNGLATTPDGKTYLTDGNGKIQTGWKTVNNNRYYFSEDGSMYKGILDLNGTRYLLGVNSGLLYRNGLATTPDGKTYLTDNNGVLQIGWHDVGEKTYYFSEDGSMYKGILDLNGTKYLLGVNSGLLYRNGLATTPDGKTYLTDNYGVIQKGLIEIKNKKYYFSDIDGSMQYGIQQVSEDKYFFGIDGSMQYGIQEANGNHYLFGVQSGKLYYGWATTPDGNKYYSDENGVMLNGIQVIDGQRYLFGVNSYKLYYGWATTPDGKTYYSNSDGIVQTGLIELNNKKYYFDENGVMQRGIIDIEGNKYYFSNNDGSMQYGIQDINGKKYLFGVYSGILYYGWATTPDGNKYYSDENGVMLNGIQVIDGQRYLFGVNSYKLYYGWATTPDGKTYYSNANGVVLTGNQTIEGSDYIFDNQGVLQSGWQTINGKTYYIYPDGTKAKYICKIAGNRYEFSSTGELQHSNIKVVMDVSYHQGYIDWNAVWNSGQIDAVILRMGYSTDEDIRFAEYISELKRLHIPYSIYWFSYARNQDDAYAEAQKTISLFRQYQLNPNFNIYYDIENWEYKSNSNINSYSISAQTYEAITSTYINTLAVNGLGARIYANTNFYNTRFNDNTRSLVEWIANYAVYDCPGNYRGWQYTSSGSVPGVSTKVDLSIFYW